ncbi:MAG: SDR family NAD(P)-dependent oxidoreductase [Myxococcales bacterium]
MTERTSPAKRRVDELFARAVEQLGTVDIMVNNAGLQRDAAFPELTLEQWNTVLSANLTVPLRAHRVREFRRRGPRPEVSRVAGKDQPLRRALPWRPHARHRDVARQARPGIRLRRSYVATA